MTLPKLKKKNEFTVTGTPDTLEFTYAQQSDFPIDPKVQQNKTSKFQELEPPNLQKEPTRRQLDVLIQLYQEIRKP